MKKWIVLLMICSVNQLFGQVIDSTKKEVKPFVLDKKAYSMNIPTGWKIQSDCQENLCSLLSPVDTLSYIDRFVDNINITVDKLPSPSYTVDKYAQFSISYLPSVVKNFKVIEKKKVKSNGYLVTYKGEKSGFAQTWRQFYFVKNSKVYIVTFATETIKYEKYLPIVDPFLNSFKLK